MIHLSYCVSIVFVHETYVLSFRFCRKSGLLSSFAIFVAQFSVHCSFEAVPRADVENAPFTSIYYVEESTFFTPHNMNMFLFTVILFTVYSLRMFTLCTRQPRSALRPLQLELRQLWCAKDGNLWIEREFRLAALLLSSNFHRHGSFISWCYEVTTSIFDAEEARNLTHLERRISNMPEGMDTV